MTKLSSRHPALKAAAHLAPLLCGALLAAAARTTCAAQPLPLPTHLSEVWQRVDELNPAVQSAWRGWQAAQADVTAARLGPPTQLSVLTQAIDPRHLHGDAWHQPVDTLARLDHVIERGDKPALRGQLADTAAATARASWIETRRSQRTEAALAYWDLKWAQEQLATLQRHAELAAANSDLAQQRLQQGDLSRLEATRLAVEAQRSQNDLGAARLTWRQAQQRLASLMRWSDPALVPSLRADDDWPEALAPAEPDVATWLARRPDIQAARLQREQAQQALTLADAQRSTDVTVSLQFEHNPVVADRLWGVGVAIPLGMAGRQDGPIKRATLAAQEADAQLDTTEAQARSLWQAQHQAVEEAHERLQRLQQHLLPQARDALRAAEFARQQGALGLQDVLDARRALYSAELALSTARADLAKAQASLFTPAPESDQP